ncbi:MAG: DNA (cytosine-5-)-methyltransferase [Bacteroidales bacterium]|nr:DNA (cytosine-5-)-methyltransferase [Bacteroidales bacterium]
MLKVTDQRLEGLSFIDLFAGIGGFHYALSSFGAKCLYASEWDKPAQETYFVNHGIMPSGDITKIAAEEIPPHDILCGGFPCQAFSISGKRLGFEDTRGTLFFDIARIVKHHRPKVVFMENVKNLALHDNGRTFRVVAGTMEELGYTMFSKVLNSGQFGVPQHRERIYMVCFRNDIIQNSTFEFPKHKKTSSLKDVLESNPSDAKIINRPDIQFYRTAISNQANLFDGDLPNRPLQIGIVNKGGQGERIYDPIGHAITLSAYGGGAGAKTGLYLINGVVRKLSPRECARLQGFPDDFIIHPNPQQAYKQFGNSVTINVLQYIVEEIANSLRICRQ